MGQVIRMLGGGGGVGGGGGGRAMLGWAVTGRFMTKLLMVRVVLVGRLLVGAHQWGADVFLRFLETPLCAPREATRELPEVSSSRVCRNGQKGKGRPVTYQGKLSVNYQLFFRDMGVSGSFSS